jgi:hypothetical protein
VGGRFANGDKRKARGREGEVISERGNIEVQKELGAGLENSLAVASIPSDGHRRGEKSGSLVLRRPLGLRDDRLSKHSGVTQFELGQ